MKQEVISKTRDPVYAVTAGATYLDIDAYACSVALAELLVMQGKRAIAYSDAPYNYSVCGCLIQDGQMMKKIPGSIPKEALRYIIVDVSDPNYLSKTVPLDRITAVYDHHTGFEEYWKERIGDRAHIEFIGAAATLIYSEWKAAGLLERMTRPTALLLIAAILDNTLDLTSSNTTRADIEAFETLCRMEGVDREWCSEYFTTVQQSVEADLKNALFNDVKSMHSHPVLPPRFAQLCVWDAQRIIRRLDEIREWFDEVGESWMLNIVDVKRRCSWFVCGDAAVQEALEDIFGIRFTDRVARTTKSFLRKEIIKIVDSYR